MASALEILEPNTVTQDQIAAGLRAFFKIMNDWKIDNDQAQILLGHPRRATFFNWKKGKYGSGIRDYDLAARLSYILGIYKALQFFYQNPELADQWVRKPNSAFGGQSALDRMLAGQITDLAFVRDYLDSVRGAW